MIMGRPKKTATEAGTPIQPVCLDDLATIYDLLEQWITNAGAYQFEGRRASQALDLIVDAGISLRSALVNLEIIVEQQQSGAGRPRN